MGRNGSRQEIRHTLQTDDLAGMISPPGWSGSPASSFLQSLCLSVVVDFDDHRLTYCDGPEVCERASPTMKTECDRLEFVRNPFHGSFFFVTDTLQCSMLPVCPFPVIRQECSELSEPGGRTYEGNDTDEEDQEDRETVRTKTVRRENPLWETKRSHAGSMGEVENTERRRSIRHRNYQAVFDCKRAGKSAQLTVSPLSEERVHGCHPEEGTLHCTTKNVLETEEIQDGQEMTDLPKGW